MMLAGRGTPGHAVEPQDETVRQRVADIILGGAGAYLRQKRSTDGQ